MEPQKFRELFYKKATEIRARHYGNTIAVSGLLAVGNICRKRCLYCGLRGPNSEIKRFRLSLDEIKRYACYLGFSVMLGLGVLSPELYTELKDAGANLYALKFETSNPEIFSSLKPDISFEDRMQHIYEIGKAGLQLGSGNIVGLPDESLDDIAADIELMERLKVTWAPIVPYMPSPSTPLWKTLPSPLIVSSPFSNR